MNYKLMIKLACEVMNCKFMIESSIWNYELQSDDKN